MGRSSSIFMAGYELVRKVYNLYLNLKLKVQRLRSTRLTITKNFTNKYLRGRPRGDVIIIVIDCLRYRNMSFTGYHRKTTPFLDTFTVKLRAFASAPHTYSSVPSILTGFYPHNHGAYISGKIKNMDQLRSFKPLRNDVVTLPEILKFYGYEVVFITSVYLSIMPLTKTFIPSRVFNISNGAETILNSALKYIVKSKKRSRNVFAYIHLGDLHEPLNPPPSYRNFFGEVKRLPNIDRWAFRRAEEQKGEVFEEYKYNKVLLYDNTLRYVDKAVQEFVLRVHDLINDPTLVIVTSDHGEEFWEHAFLEQKYFYDPRGFYGVGHGHNLFNEVIEVPLLIQGSEIIRINRNISKSKTISLVDIVPTVLDWLGLEFREEIFDGYSLLRYLPKDRYVLSEAMAYGYEKKALIKDNYKLLYAENDGIKWLFDLTKDPYEEQPMTENELIHFYLRELKRILVRDILRHKGLISKHTKY